MAKSNIRSFRYTDEIKEILEGYKGNSMNEKFCNLVFYCFSQVPVVEKRLRELNREIEQRRELLNNVNNQCHEIDMLISNLNDIKCKINNASMCVDILSEKLM